MIEATVLLIERHYFSIGILFIAIFTWVAFWYQFRMERDRRQNAMAAEVDKYDPDEPVGMA